MTIGRGDAPAPETQRDQVRRLVHERGEQATADHLHVTRWTIGRLLAGLPLREATRTLIATRLEAVQE
jgi:hypothetical protein